MEKRKKSANLKAAKKAENRSKSPFSELLRDKNAILFIIFLRPLKNQAGEKFFLYTKKRKKGTKNHKK